MKKISTLLALSAASLVGIFAACSSSENSDKIIAEVGAEKIYQSDLEFLKRTAPHPYAMPGQEGAALENIIESRVIYQAGKEILGDEQKIENRLLELEERFLSQMYQEIFLGQNLGFTDEKLQAFFNRNKKIFAADSCKELNDCRDAVAKKIYLSENAEAAKNYVEAQKLIVTAPSLNLGFVETQDSAEAKNVEKTFREKLSLFALPHFQQEDFSASSREGILKNDTIFQLLFGKDSIAVDDFRSVRIGDKFIVMKVFLRRAPELKATDNLDSILRNRFADEYAEKLVNNSEKNLLEKFAIRFVDFSKEEVQKYFESHKKSADEIWNDSLAEKVQWAIWQDAEYPLDSMTVLVTSNDKPILFEKDVKQMRSEMPPRFRLEYGRRRSASVLLNWKLQATAAREVGLDKSPMTAKLRNSIKLRFYRSALLDHLGDTGYLISEDTLKAIFDRIGSKIYPEKKFESVRGKMGIIAHTPDNIFRYEFYKRYPNSTVTDLDSMKVAVFLSAMNDLTRNWFENFRRDLYQKYPVKILDSAFLPRRDLFSTSDLIAFADSIHQAHNLNGAYLNWVRVISLGENNDSILSRAVYELAIIDFENARYKDSDAELAAYLRVWPNGEKAEKVLFSRAFQARENLKEDSLALALFQEFKTKYPKSDLIESVDWSIKDIQSGGKLSEDLLKKIEEQE